MSSVTLLPGFLLFICPLNFFLFLNSLFQRPLRTVFIPTGLPYSFYLHPPSSWGTRRSLSSFFLKMLFPLTQNSELISGRCAPLHNLSHNMFPYIIAKLLRMLSDASTLTSYVLSYLLVLNMWMTQRVSKDLGLEILTPMLQLHLLTSHLLTVWYVFPGAWIFPLSISKNNLFHAIYMYSSSSIISHECGIFYSLSARQLHAFCT